MKVGDKVYCKRDFHWNDHILYQKDYSYLIEEMWYTNDYEKYHGFYWRHISDDNKILFIPSYWVAVCGAPSDSDKRAVRHLSLTKMGKCYYLYDYFYSIAEMRRNKLKKIEVK